LGGAAPDSVPDNVALRRRRSESGAWFAITDEDLFGAMDLGRPGLEAVRRAAEARDYDAAYAAWGRYWAGRATPAYPVRQRGYASALRRHAPHLVRLLIERADDLWRGDFTWANYRVRRGGRLFEWVDSTGETAYIGLHYFFWLQPVGRAYLLTRVSRYAAMFREVVCSWWDALPDLAGLDRFDGIVLNSGLGSSLRCVAMMDGYSLMRDCDEFTPELHRKVLRIFLGHTRYIVDDVLREYAPHNGIPTAGSWAVTAGTLLPEFRESERWRRVGVMRLREAVQRTFEADGGHVEQCPQYHLANMRDITRALMVLAANDLDDLSADQALWKKLERIFDYPIRIAHPTGHLAVFNSGVYGTEWKVFLPIGMRLFDSELHAWAAARFIEPGFVPVAKQVSEYAWFMDGDWFEALERARAGRARPPSFTSECLSDSGVAVLRSGWDADARCLVFDCNRRPWGGHPHAGRLSFDLFAYGTALVVNPGSTMSYSMSVYEDWCVQTISHNTVVVNGKSQGGRVKVDRHALHSRTRLLAWRRGERFAFVAASHDMYQASDGVVHQRAVAFVDGGYYVIFDRLLGGEDGMPVSWLLHSPLPLRLRGDGAIATPDGRPGLLVVPDTETARTGRISLGTGYAAVPVEYRPGYRPLDAWREDVPYVRLDSAIDGCLGGRTFAVVLVPFKERAPWVRLHVESSAEGDRLPVYEVRIVGEEHSDLLTLDFRGEQPGFAVERLDDAGLVVWSE